MVTVEKKKRKSYYRNIYSLIWNYHQPTERHHSTLKSKNQTRKCMYIILLKYVPFIAQQADEV